MKICLSSVAERTRSLRSPPTTGPRKVTSTAMFAIGILMAANAAGTDGDPVPTIEVRDVLPADPARAPGAAAVLSSEDLQRLRPFTLHDAFSFVAGLRTLDDDAFGRRAGISVRGAPGRRSRKVLLLEDGVPINASTYLDPSAHYTPPVERLDRVDVLKANGQILHGPLNNHGIINFRNKRPTADPVTEAELGFGNQSADRQHVMHRRTDGALGTVISLTRFSADGSFDVEFTEYRDIYAALEWQIGSRQDLSVAAVSFRERSHYDESNLTPQEFAIAPRTKQGRFGQEYNNIAVDYERLDVTHRFDISPAWLMSTRVFASDLDRPRFTVNPGRYDVAALPELWLVDGDGAFVAGPDGNGTMISRNRRYRSTGFESRMEYRLAGEGSVSHTLQWGVRAERQRFDDRRSEGATGEVLTRGNRGALTRHEPFGARALSAFVQNVMTVGDFTLTPGVRAESYVQRKQRVFPAVTARERYSDSLLLPGVSLQYEGFENTSLYGSVQRGYTPAIARGSTFPLIPETGINFQAGAHLTVAAGVSIEVSAFHNSLENTLVQLPFVDPATGANVFINAADSRAYGTDIGLRLDSASTSLRPLNLFALVAYNFTRATFTDGPVRGNRVPEVPLHAGSVTLGLEHRAGWHFSITMGHASRFFTDPANTTEAALVNEDGDPLGTGDLVDLREPIVLGVVPGRNLISARAGYELHSVPVTLWIHGRNLTDRQYVADYSNGMRPGAARAIMAGASLRF